MAPAAEEFYRAAVPEPFTLGGQRLLPFSIGHLLLLHRIGSPFVAPEGKADAADLALAAMICGRTFKDGVALLDSPDFGAEARQWLARAIRPTLAQRLHLARPVRFHAAQKIRHFCDYMTAGTRLPAFKVSESNRQNPLPVVLMVKNLIQQELGIADDEIMDRPWALSLWDYMAIQANGGLELYDEDQLKAAFDVGIRLKKSLGN